MARFLKYPGSKETIAEWVIGLLPPGDCYVEPFFGSGAGFFSMPPRIVEIINDIDDYAISFYRVIREESKFQEFQRILEFTLYAKKEYDESILPGKTE